MRWFQRLAFTGLALALGMGSLAAQAFWPFSSAPAAKAAQGAWSHAVALGDTGSGNANQQAIAQAMVRYHHQQPFPLMLHLGDILYPSGDYAKDGARLFCNVYEPLGALGVTIRTTLGNHDVVHPEWVAGAVTFYQMPARYYRFEQGAATFLAIDTNLLKDEAQWAWVVHQLKTVKTPWLVVFGHHPLYTSGTHSTDAEVAQLQTQWLPQLQRGVAKGTRVVYLAGHDHHYERFGLLQPAAAPALKKGHASPVLSFVSGGGGAYIRSLEPSQRAAGSVVSKATYHFLALHYNPQWLWVEALDPQLQRLDCVVWAPPLARKRALVAPVGTAGCDWV
jgi:acid phosphatase